jgi:hypothetical protein
MACSSRTRAFWFMLHLLFYYLKIKILSTVLARGRHVNSATDLVRSITNPFPSQPHGTELKAY